MPVLSRRGGPGPGALGRGGASGTRDAALALRRGEAQPIDGDAWGPAPRSWHPVGDRGRGRTDGSHGIDAGRCSTGYGWVELAGGAGPPGAGRGGRGAGE